MCFKLSIWWVTSSVKDVAESRLEFVYHLLECVQRKVIRVITNKKKVSRGEFEKMKWFDLERRDIRANVSKACKMVTAI